MTSTATRTHQVRRLLTVASAALALTAAGAGGNSLAAGKTGSAAHDGAGARTRGNAILVGEAAPGAAVPTTSSPTIGAHQRLPVLQPRSSGTGVRQAAPAPAAAAPATAAAPSAGAAPVQSFDGVNAAQNMRAAGFDTEPPDEGLGAGNGFVVNFVNVTGAIYRPNGQRLGAPFYLNTFFKEDPATATSDPRVYYDSSSGRWFATMVEYQFNADGTPCDRVPRGDLATSANG